MSQPASRTALFLAAVLFCFNPYQPGLLHANQSGTPVTAANQIQHGGYALALNGHITVAENSAKPFVPASTLKIVTSLAALDILGPDHRFSTRISRDQHDNLYI